MLSINSRSGILHSYLTLRTYYHLNSRSTSPLCFFKRSEYPGTSSSLLIVTPSTKESVMENILPDEIIVMSVHKKGFPPSLTSFPVPVSK